MGTMPVFSMAECSQLPLLLWPSWKAVFLEGLYWVLCVTYGAELGTL